MKEFVRRHGSDIGVPLAIALLATVEILGVRPPGTLAGLALEWGACAILVLRRRLPMLVGALASIATSAMPVVGPELNDLSGPILIAGLAVFSLGRYVRDLRGLIPLAITVLVLMASMELSRAGSDLTDIVFAAVLLVPCYVFGRVMRLLAERNTILAQHAALLLTQQESAQREAVAAERARMAREVHDVIAHSVSVMTVQAAAAEDLVTTDPERALIALRDIQAAGRGALAETGRLLRILRDHDDELGLSPERGLADLDGLVAEFRRSGLIVDLTVTGELDDLPPGVGVSAYRVLREALTNGLKHAADRQVTLRVARTAATIALAAENNAAAPRTDGGGLGLIGMAERVSVHGGRLTHQREGGRFRLDVELPLAVTS